MMKLKTLPVNAGFVLLLLACVWTNVAYPSTPSPSSSAKVEANFWPLLPDDPLLVIAAYLAPEHAGKWAAVCKGSHTLHAALVATSPFRATLISGSQKIDFLYWRGIPRALQENERLSFADLTYLTTHLRPWQLLPLAGHITANAHHELTARQQSNHLQTILGRLYARQLPSIWLQESFAAARDERDPNYSSHLTAIFDDTMVGWLAQKTADLAEADRLAWIKHAYSVLMTISGFYAAVYHSAYDVVNLDYEKLTAAGLEGEAYVQAAADCILESMGAQLLAAIDNDLHPEQAQQAHLVQHGEPDFARPLRGPAIQLGGHAEGEPLEEHQPENDPAANEPLANAHGEVDEFAPAGLDEALDDREEDILAEARPFSPPLRDIGLMATKLAAKAVLKALRQHPELPRAQVAKLAYYEAEKTVFLYFLKRLHSPAKGGKNPLQLYYESSFASLPNSIDQRVTFSTREGWQAWQALHLRDLKEGQRHFVAGLVRELDFVVTKLVTL